MSRIIGLLQLVLAAKTGYDSLTAYKMISKATGVLVFAVIAAMLTGTLVVGLTYFAYYMQLQNGIQPLDAMLYTGGALVALIAVFALLAVNKANKLFHEAKNAARISAPASPVVDKVSGVAQSFLDGLLKRNEVPSKKN